jgi:Protein of unknown function (DUF4230)
VTSARSASAAYAAPRRRWLSRVFLVGIVGKLFIHQPFTTKVIDRTSPPVLTSLRDLSQYKAASAQFEVLVDIEKDVKYLPSAIAGERTFFVGIGSVEATIDFSKVGSASIAVSPDHKSASIIVPHAVLSDAILDTQKSYVAARNRGLANRVAGMFSDSPTNDRPLYDAAASKMRASAEQTGLIYRAEANTRAMLESLVKNLGYEQVNVRFSDPAAST